MKRERKYICEDCKFFTFDEFFYDMHCTRSIVLMKNPYREACSEFRITKEAEKYYRRKERWGE